MTISASETNHIRAYGGTLLSRVVAAAATLSLHIVVARGLGPSVYAAAALFVTLLAVAQMLLSFGNEALLVREGGMSSPRARSVAVVAPLLASLLSALLAGTATSVESLFDIHGLASLLAWGLPVLPLQLMQVVPRAELLQRQEYLKLARADALGSIAGWLPAMAVYLLTENIAAIALYLVVMHAARLLLYRRSMAKPPATYGNQRVRLVAYLHSWRIISIETATFLTTTVDDLLVAANLGAAMLGMYHLAYRVIVVTQEFFAGVMRTLGLPVYVRAAPDRVEVYRLVARDTRFLAAVVVPLLTAVILLADPLVLIVLGRDWSEVVPVLQILAFEALRQSMLALGSQGMIALGDESRLLRYSLTSAGVLLPVFVVLSFTDLLTFAAGFVAVNTLLNVIFYVHVRGSFARPFRPLFFAWLPGLSASAVLGILLAGFRVLAQPDPVVLLGFGALALATAWGLAGVVFPDLRGSVAQAVHPLRRRDSARPEQRTLRVFTDGPFDETNVHLRDLYASMVERDPTLEVRPLDLREYMRENWRRMFYRNAAVTDIIHIHYPLFLYEGRSVISAMLRGSRRMLQLLVLRLMGVRLVHTLHDATAHDFPHRRWERLALLHLIHSADAVTTLSRAAGRMLFTDFGYANDVRIARHCVYRVAAFDGERRRRWRTANGIADEDVVILLFGTVLPYKGFDRLMQAALDIEDVSLTLVCAGRGMAEVTAGHGRPGLRVLTIDRFIDAEETASLMDAADFGALPYRRILHSGSAMLFASHGCPVVAPRMGVFLDHEREHAIGLYYDPGDQGDLRRVLREAARRSRAAYAGAFEDFRVTHREEDEARALLEVYRRLAKGR